MLDADSYDAPVALFRLRDDDAGRAIFINSRKDFRVVPFEPFTHMGALLADAVLQAGIKYETVVKPRVECLKRDYPSAVTTSGFMVLLRKPGP